MSGAGASSFARPLPTEAPIAATIPLDTEAGILRLVVQTFPNAGNQLEAAVRMAAQLGFVAGSHLGAGR